MYAITHLHIKSHKAICVYLSFFFIFTFETPRQSLKEKYAHKHIKCVYSSENQRAILIRNIQILSQIWEKIDILQKSVLVILNFGLPFRTFNRLRFSLKILFSNDLYENKSLLYLFVKIGKY